MRKDVADPNPLVGIVFGGTMDIGNQKSTVELRHYSVVDGFFGSPYIDVDTQRDLPIEHRYVHGGFEGTDTRFSFYYPPASEFGGRLYQPLEGGNAGHENIYNGMKGWGLEMIFRLGGYCVESNMGHIGDVLDNKAGSDATIYGFRAAAECARLSKHIAFQLYGYEPKFSYVFGGSGGGLRAPQCLTYAPGVWDGALPYMGGPQIAVGNVPGPLRTALAEYGCMFNVRRLLGDKIYKVIDAMWPGGSGDPFSGLEVDEIEELNNLYKLGFPRGAEFLIEQPVGQMWFWASSAQELAAEDEFFRAFWSSPGHMGHDRPDAFNKDLIDQYMQVKRCIIARDLVDDAAFSGSEFNQMRAYAKLFVANHNMWHVPMILELSDPPNGYLPGARISAMVADGVERTLYCVSAIGRFVLCDGAGESAKRRLAGIGAGDFVRISNRDFLAYCYYYRHHASQLDFPDQFSQSGVYIYRQYENPVTSPFMGVCQIGRYKGKMLWVQHTLDASTWPSRAVVMRDLVARETDAEALGSRFRIRWTQNAEHVPPQLLNGCLGRAANTLVVSYQPIIEQCLLDLQGWVEADIEPLSTNFDVVDGQIVLSNAIDKRGGIQPIVSISANGSSATMVNCGDVVDIKISAVVAKGAGSIVEIKVDYLGDGSFPYRHRCDGDRDIVDIALEKSFDEVGCYFVTAMVESSRSLPDEQRCRIPNLASARVLVT